MKRLLAGVLLGVLLAGAFSAQAAAPEKWWDAYDRGVTAVNAKNYKLAAESLQKAIAEMPNEGTNVRTRRTLITYVPHFWLGIAKFNLGDTDGALREWKISQDQGVVARTEYYSKMKDWVARAEAEKVRDAQRDATGPKTAAGAAISNAMIRQADALSANGERTESYQAAKRKLDEARAAFQKAGTDVKAYKAAEQVANQATTLFTVAAEEGNKQKAARTAAAAQKKNTPPPARAIQQPVQQPVQHAAILTPQPAPVKVLETPPPPLAKPDAGLTPVLTEAEVAKQIADQTAKRKKLEEPKKTASVDVAGGTAAPEKPARLDLKPAYRAFASGDVAASERLLNEILKSQQAAEAYLLRGCARYTRAMLSRDGNRLLMMATDDFRAALDRNRGLRLDRRAFSPKLVAFFEDVRKKR